ncbi:phage terminase large subunit family protein [Martelella mangrovi]|uniref:Phage terminase large subunit GpA-like protein n=1 Tax=Martelella mangrovi TaxID=1397477 RepID=A0ABV2IIV9_9HYPH
MTMLFNPERLMFEALANACEPPPPVDYLGWAKSNIVFSERISAFPGPYREDMFPFFSEILRALSPDDPCSIVTLSKSAQVGGTVLANIFLLGTLDLDPCDFLYVHPTEENASRWSKTKLMPLLRETVSVRALFPEAGRDGGNSILYKERVDGRGAVQAAGANSAAGLSMISPRAQVQDDLAKWVYNEAGDPESQADSRSKAFFNRKVFKISTPLIAPGCRITANYLAGTQERYHVPCPHCHELQPLEWENMRDHIDPQHPELAHFVCVHCGCEIHEHHRQWMVDPENGAEWVAKYPERARYHRSFHVWVPYSPLESWEAIARAWLKVQSGGEDDKEKGAGAEQVFFNDTLGLAYEADNKAIAWEDLRDRAEETGFRRGVVPGDMLALTIGIDVQGDRVEWLLRGWGRNKTSAVIDYGVIDSRAGSHLPGYREHSGHISEHQVMEALDRLIAKRWPDENGRLRDVDRVAIDGNAYTEDVWFWARRHPRSKVIMVRGDNRDAAPLLSQVREYDKRGRPKKQKWSTRFFNFNASVMKMGLYRDFRKDDPEQPGFISFAIGLGDNFYQQATSEVRIKEKDRNGYPRWVWKLPDGQRNEVLDMLNQSRAAAIRLNVPYWTDEEWDARAEELARQEPEEQGDLEDLIGSLAVSIKAVSDAGKTPEEKPKPSPDAPVSDRVAAAMRRAERAAQRTRPG